MLQGSDFEQYQIRPGDSMQTHCVYDTAGASSRVRFGTETRDEMCMIFLFFYPAQFRGVDESGQPASLAFCGLADNRFQVSACGGLSQVPIENGILPFTQVERQAIDPEATDRFGVSSVSGPGEPSEASACSGVYQAGQLSWGGGDDDTAKSEPLEGWVIGVIAAGAALVLVGGVAAAFLATRAAAPGVAAGA